MSHITNVAPRFITGARLPVSIEQDGDRVSLE